MEFSWYYIVVLCVIVLILSILILVACIRQYSNDGLCVKHTPFSRDIRGEYAIVTGANRGIGRAVTTLLIERGCNVILACRNKEKALEAIKCIKNELNTQETKLRNRLGDMRFIELDLSSFESIDTFVDNIVTNHIRIDILVLNAAINPPNCLSNINGLETNFAVDYFGHIYLTNKLFHIFKKNNFARIVCVVSSVLKYGSIDWNLFIPNSIYKVTKEEISDIFDNEENISNYNSFSMYCSVKLAQCLWIRKFQRIIDEHCEEKNCDIILSSIHPGLVDTGNPDEYRKNYNCFQRCCSFSFGWFRKLAMLTPKQATNTILHCILYDNHNGSSDVFKRGGYHSNCKSYSITYGKKTETELDEIGDKLWHITTNILHFDWNGLH